MGDWLVTNWRLVLAVLAVASAIFAAGRWVGKVDAAVKQFNEFAKEIRAQLKDIFLRLPATPAPVSSSSPLQLTDFGRKMAEFMDASSWARETVPSLRENVAGKLAFEIDVFSRDYVREHMDRDDRVAKCMYEMGVDRDAALRVLQVVLRDELLKITGQVAE